MERIIAHADINYFYAAVECRKNPELRNVPMVVGGDEKKRHGIVLAKNEPARRLGIKTAETLWQARRKCPELVVVPPHFDEYEEMSRKSREIFSRYTDRVEPFGADECWLDLTGCVSDIEKGKLLADNLRKEMREELGITISVGVSFNKVFAKLASDYKKPDATTVISRENFKSFVWPMPVNALLYVGRSTEKRLNSLGIRTIGDLAKSERLFLLRYLGKNGEGLWLYANGMDTSPVSSQRQAPKSIGNSMTLPHDINDKQEIKTCLYMLCEKVALRLRNEGMSCSTVAVLVRNSDFIDTERQATLDAPSDTSQELFDIVWRVYNTSFSSVRNIRSLGVRAIRLEKSIQEQISLFPEDAKRIKHKRIETVKDNISRKYGANTVTRGVLLNSAFSMSEKDEN